MHDEWNRGFTSEFQEANWVKRQTSEDGWWLNGRNAANMTSKMSTLDRIPKVSNEIS